MILKYYTKTPIRYTRQKLGRYELGNDHEYFAHVFVLIGTDGHLLISAKKRPAHADLCRGRISRGQGQGPFGSRGAGIDAPDRFGFGGRRVLVVFNQHI